MDTKSYKSFGCNLNGIGVSYLAALNYTAIEELRYTEIFRKLEVAIQIPRFPQVICHFIHSIKKKIIINFIFIHNSLFYLTFALCFPSKLHHHYQSLKEYSATIGREVADLIASIEKRLRIRLHK